MTTTEEPVTAGRSDLMAQPRAGAVGTTQRAPQRGPV